MKYKQCALCKCDATCIKFGFVVCTYHFTHGEDDPPCPTCKHPKPVNSDSSGEHHEG